MATTAPTRPRPAIGYVRVSRTNGRGGDSFSSPEDQRDRIQEACEAHGLRLIGEPIVDLDVSGGSSLAKRHDLRAAVEAIEAGRVEALVTADHSRLVRSVQVQYEIIDRIEAAGGRWVTPEGEVTHRNATGKFTRLVQGGAAEMEREIATEKSAKAVARAVARGALPYPNVPPGYVRGEDGKLDVDHEAAPVVVRAFEMRAEGATLAEVRDWLRENGIVRSYHGVGSLLASRVVLGEIHFGDYEPNLKAHEPIVDRDLWQRVQRTKSIRGRKAKSDRLLARLGVLRCGSCNARMSVGVQTQNGRRYPFYRCSPTGDCKSRVTISATMVEGIVTDAVRVALADVQGRASVEENVIGADRDLAHAQADLDAAIRSFAGFEDEAAARDRLLELRHVRDEAQEARDQLGQARATETIDVEGWDQLILEEKRDLIRATVKRVTVAPGRGPERIKVELFRE